MLRDIASEVYTAMQDDVLLDQVEAIGERAARHMLCDEAARLQHTDLPAATDCAALTDRIDALIRPA